jgi:indolepyruvate ferredoxin oxidoreductase
VQPTSDFIRDRDWSLPAQALKQNIFDAAGPKEIEFIDATALALKHMGDALYTNPLLMGYAWQKGWIPLALDAITKAIELNAISVPNNLKAFAIGRISAEKPELVKIDTRTESIIEFKRKISPSTVSDSLADIVALRAEALTFYQNAAYAERYKTLVAKVANAEDKLGESTALARTVAHYLFKVMAYKDEYEVARLMSTQTFKDTISQQFEGDYQLAYHLAPPLISKIDPKTGRPKKIRFGAWLGTAFTGLAKLKVLRGTPLDVFGYSNERQHERRLSADYQAWLATISDRLTTDNLGLAVEIAQALDGVRGYGPVKKIAMEKFDAQWTQYQRQWLQT